VFISNLANSVIHKILEKAINKPEIPERYNKEIKNSWEIAKRYREKINPANKSLSEKDTEEIKKKIINKVESELKIRIERGYENINLSLVEEFVEKSLNEMNIK
jgi:hypothetical protein